MKGTQSTKRLTEEVSCGPNSSWKRGQVGLTKYYRAEEVGREERRRRSGPNLRGRSGHWTPCPVEGFWREGTLLGKERGGGLPGAQGTVCPSSFSIARICRTSSAVTKARGTAHCVHPSRAPNPMHVILRNIGEYHS